MAGERLEVANLSWHGLDGDRRPAFRRINDLFTPYRREDGVKGDLPTHVRTLDGQKMSVFVGQEDRASVHSLPKD